MSDSPALSVVLRVVGGGDFLKRCLQELVEQAKSHDLEIIVPCDASVPGVDQLRSEFPSARFVAVPEPAGPRNAAGDHEMFDLRTAAGLRVARGRIVALLEDYGVPRPDWCREILAAHELPHGVIGGAVEYAGRGLLGRAVFLLDFGRYEPPLEEGRAEYLSDVNVSYKREILDEVRETWWDSYNEVTTHWALQRRGTSLWQHPQIVVRQDRGTMRLSRLVAERFWWGWIFGRARCRELGLARRMLYAAGSPLIPLLFVARLAAKAPRRRGHVGRVMLASPLLLLLSACWALGELVAYVSQGRVASAAASAPERYSSPERARVV